MQIDRISYQKVFPLGVYTNHRIGMEASLDEGEDVAQALQQLKKTVEDFHEKTTPLLPEPEIISSNNYDEHSNGEEQLKITIEQQAANMVKEMVACKTTEALKTFRGLAFSESMKKFTEVQNMYETRLRSLSSKTSPTK